MNPAPSTPGPHSALVARCEELQQEVKRLGYQRDFLDRLLASATLLLRSRALVGKDRGLAFREVTRAVSRILEVQRVSIWTLTENPLRITCLDLYDGRQDHHLSGTILQGSDFPAYFQELLKGGVISVDDAIHDPRTAEFAAPYLIPLDISSMLDVPIRIQDRLYGVLCHEQTGPARRWTPEEKRFASFSAGLVALAIELNPD